MAELPKPIQVGDFYLAAILDELKGLRADLAAARAPVVVNNGPVEFREPDRQGMETRGGTPPPPVPPEKSLLRRITGR